MSLAATLYTSMGLYAWNQEVCNIDSDITEALLQTDVMLNKCNYLHKIKYEEAI